jgi:hypothetical protein
MTSLGIEPATFPLVAVCLNQLRYRAPPLFNEVRIIFITGIGEDISLSDNLQTARDGPCPILNTNGYVPPRQHPHKWNTRSTTWRYERRSFWATELRLSGDLPYGLKAVGQRPVYEAIGLCFVIACIAPSLLLKVDQLLEQNKLRSTMEIIHTVCFNILKFYGFTSEFWCELRIILSIYSGVLPYTALTR